MSTKLTIFGNVTNGVVQLPYKFHKMITDLGLPRFKMVISEDRPKRSNPQNAYWWGVLVPHVLEGLRDSGHTFLSPDCKEHCELVHELICDKYLPKEVNIVLKDGYGFIERGRTSRLNTKEMTDLIDNVRHWALEMFGIEIPLPDELNERV